MNKPSAHDQSDARPGPAEIAAHSLRRIGLEIETIAEIHEPQVSPADEAGAVESEEFDPSEKNESMEPEGFDPAAYRVHLYQHIMRVRQHLEMARAFSGAQENARTAPTPSEEKASGSSDDKTES